MAEDSKIYIATVSGGTSMLGKSLENFTEEQQIGKEENDKTIQRSADFSNGKSFTVTISANTGIEQVAKMIRETFEQGIRTVDEQVTYLCQVKGYDYNTALHIVKTAVMNGVSVEYAETMYKSFRCISDALKTVGQKITYAVKQFDLLSEQFEPEMDVVKEITALEKQRKHCKNYLELKQIDRRLNELKRNRRKHKK